MKSPLGFYYGKEAPPTAPSVLLQVSLSGGLDNMEMTVISCLDDVVYKKKKKNGKPLHPRNH